MEKVDILGAEISCVDINEAVENVRKVLESGGKASIFTPNPEILQLSYKNPELKSALDDAYMLLPDGIGVVLAAKILGRPLKGRVTGIDFLHRLCELCAEQRLGLFLLGAKEGVARKAAESLKKLYPQIEICGVQNGYFGNGETESIIDKINSSGAAVTAVCLGAPKQELFIHKYRDKIKSNICIGVGGALDVISGNVKRAPKVFQKLGLEWLYRSICQPKRFVRLFSLPVFVINVFRQKLRHSESLRM